MYFIYSLDPLVDGLYFTLSGSVYLHNETVYIEDIGPDVDDRSNNRGAALVCHTDIVNTACCRSSDNNGNGPIGDWFYPDNSQVIHNNQDASTNNTFVRVGFHREVRLVTLGSPTGPLGHYKCEVPNSRNDSVIAASIYITSNGKLTKAKLAEYT